jgi:hypothetical protein
VFLGFFILITSLGPFVSATFFPTQIDAGVSVTISRTLAVINAAGITWIIAGWMWYRGHWWWAVICTLTGMMLISVGLPDR